MTKRRRLMLSITALALHCGAIPRTLSRKPSANEQNKHHIYMGDKKARRALRICQVSYLESGLSGIVPCLASLQQDPEKLGLVGSWELVGTTGVWGGLGAAAAGRGRSVHLAAQATYISPGTKQHQSAGAHFAVQYLLVRVATTVCKRGGPHPALLLDELWYEYSYGCRVRAPRSSYQTALNQAGDEGFRLNVTPFRHLA